MKKKFINEEIIKETLTNYGIDNVDEEITKINQQVKNLVLSYKKKPSIAQKQYEEGINFGDVYKNTQDLNLPDWVISNIDEARVIGNSLQTIVFPDGTKYQINNNLNDLSATNWLNFTTSVFSTFYGTKGKDSYAHEIRKIHPSPKPPQLMKSIIEFFTKKNELVFDYFMGVGGTLLGAGLCNRLAAGIDLNQSYLNAYHEAAKEIGVNDFPTICGDSLEILKNKKTMEKLLDSKKISLILIDPPYGNMMSKEKTGADINVYGNVATPFTNDERDLGNVSLGDFYHKLKESVELSLPYLKSKGYIVIFIKDLQPSKKHTNLLHAEIIRNINKIPEINYKGLRIWADRSAKLFPYGYPCSFVANQINQYILIFRKEK